MTTVDPETRAAIADVLALYCHAIDRRRWTLMDACFHEDAKYTLGTIDGTWRDFLTTARALIDPLPTTHHQLGQTLHMCDGESVRTETYFTAVHRVPFDAPPGVFGGRGHEYHAVIGGRYVDSFARSGDRWLIARRIVIIDWRHDLSPPAEASNSGAAADPALALHFPAMTRNAQ